MVSCASLRLRDPTVVDKIGSAEEGGRGIKYGLPEAVCEQICEVLSRYPQVKQAILYGSRANRSGSDIDLTLRGGVDLMLNVIYKILNDLDELLLPYTIHLSIFDDISDQDVIAHIQRVGVVFLRRASLILSHRNGGKEACGKVNAWCTGGC